MKLTLMIEDSAATIAAVLAALPGGTEWTPEPTKTIDMGVGGTVPNSIVEPDADDNGPADANAPTVDDAGLPWDERIHSSNKKLTAKGLWTKRKGVDASTIASVEAELRGGAPVPMEMPDRPIPFPTAMPMQPISMAAAPLAMTPQAAPAMPTATAAPAMPTAMPAATAPAMPVIPSAEPAASSTVTFPTFMATISQQMQAGVISEDELKWVADQIGVSVITDCAAQPEKIDNALALFRQYGKWVD